MKKKVYCPADFIGDKEGDDDRIGTCYYVCWGCDSPLPDGYEAHCPSCLERIEKRHQGNKGVDKGTGTKFLVESRVEHLSSLLNKSEVNLRLANIEISKLTKKLKKVTKENNRRAKTLGGYW